ncbi:hypothetical protein, partial [Rhizobium leguminosarum]|uniref:hypothetical protein n=1 Tax=Rhizobium leguminosarum TaxID=384 RepID=UPI00197E6112
IRRLAVAMWFHFRPLGVRQHKSFHLQLESQTSPRRNPEPQQPLEHDVARKPLTLFGIML